MISACLMLPPLDPNWQIKPQPSHHNAEWTRISQRKFTGYRKKDPASKNCMLFSFLCVVMWSKKKRINQSFSGWWRSCWKSSARLLPDYFVQPMLFVLVVKKWEKSNLGGERRLQNRFLDKLGAREERMRTMNRKVMSVRSWDLRLPSS